MNYLLLCFLFLSFSFIGNVFTFPSYSGVLGDRNGLILAPMRDLIVRLPLDVEREFAHWLLEEFAEVDMNALDIPPLALVDGQLGPAIGVPASLRRTAVAH